MLSIKYEEKLEKLHTHAHRMWQLLASNPCLLYLSKTVFIVHNIPFLVAPCSSDILGLLYFSWGNAQPFVVHMLQIACDCLRGRPTTQGPDWKIAQDDDSQLRPIPSCGWCVLKSHSWFWPGKLPTCTAICNLKLISRSCLCNWLPIHTRAGHS